MKKAESEKDAARKETTEKALLRMNDMRAVSELQDDLAKAFDTAKLAKFGDEFARSADKIRKEYAKLKADLTTDAKPVDETTTTLDTRLQIADARTALAAQKYDTAEAGIARARAMLEQVAKNGAYDFEISYLTDQIRDVALALNQAQADTALATEQSAMSAIEQIKLEAQGIEALQVGFDSGTFVSQVKAAIDEARRDLAANPFVVPVIAAPSLSDSASLRSAAAKIGGR